jgi:cardiolipin synthase
MTLTIVLVIAHAVGLITAFAALMSTRTSQGAIAWIISLVIFPYLAVPAYWVFGRSKFRGYIVARKDEDADFRRALSGVREGVEPFRRELPDEHGRVQAVELLAQMPFLGGNAVELLIDGEATFESIFAGMDRAQHYLLIQFYIVADDDLGRALKERMIAKAKEGVRVLFLYDEIGSGKLPRSYVSELREVGVEASAFQSTRGSGNRFQLNFRNHRKIVVVDGVEGWVGGHNVGDEYMGRDPQFGAWRDTHMRIVGPSALGLQLSFLEDWCWARDEIPELSWEPRPAESGDVPVLILPSGPADAVETASLMFQHAIHSAAARVWIASPYFIPDEGVTGALQLAALRGVDVRILIPDKPDHLLVYYSAFAFARDLLDTNIGIYRYGPGFLHEKALLIDGHVSGIGTANLDNRSFRLNFEVTGIVVDETFASQVEQMFRADFASATKMSVADLDAMSVWKHALARAAYLTAPVQ